MTNRKPKKVRAWIAETGREVHADNDIHWGEVHDPPAGRRPVLFCRGNGTTETCSNRLIAVETQNKTKGTTTRFFRFHKSVGSDAECTHGDTAEGVVRLVSKSTSESDEHAWLKKYVAEVASNCGLESTSEQPLINGQVRADVFVADVERGRIEVQRVRTNIPKRTDSYPDVIWLLRMTFAENPANRNALFSCPCVQVRISERVPSTDPSSRWPTQLIVAEPWRDGSEARQLFVRASGTVLQKSASPTQQTVYRRGAGGHRRAVVQDRFFETKPVDLATFLVQVWSGERHWHPRGAIHSSAGWALDCDVEDYHRWKAELRAAQSARRTNLSTRVPPCTDVTVGPSEDERIAAPQLDVAPHREPEHEAKPTQSEIPTAPIAAPPPSVSRSEENGQPPRNRWWSRSAFKFWRR